MKTYVVTLLCEMEVEAENEAEAISNAESDLWDVNIIRSCVTYAQDDEEE